MRIGLAVVATGKYVQFLPQLKASADEFFMRGHGFSFLAMCDWYGKDDAAYVPHEPWPGPTIHRHRHMAKMCDALGEFQCFDYLFMVDADMRFVAPVGDEILSDLVGTIHPGFWNKPRSQYTYENRPESAACIKSGTGERYYAGGFQGGRTDVYLQACRSIADNVAKDEANGITAVWHDESHWNRYLFENPPTLELDPGYCYPESLELPFEKKLLALDKDHAAMRS